MMFHDLKNIVKNMTIKDSIESLLDNLIEQTIKKRIEWKYDYRKAEIEIDGLNLHFYISWRLKLKGYVSDIGFLSIKGEDIDLSIFYSDFPDLISKLDSFFRREYFDKNKPSEKKYIDRFDSLSKKISLEEYRDMKILSILNDKETI
jgi:hypothetical protein